MENTSQWERIKELFEAGLQCAAERRVEFLSNACAGDQSLRLEVESLLAAYEQSDGLSVHPLTGELLEEGEPEKVIGPYRLKRKIGEGGMGQVWLAEQCEPISRLVALKLINGGIFDSALLRRFQAERQSLATMDHPAIAKVFDAGATAKGQPYFVMEYVPGEPITNYCDAGKLLVQRRLELFIRTCEGVQHAHQKAIIHRDLKPANILVVEVDGQPTPRIIDFGLAKVIEPIANGANSPTRAEGFVGTPGYMSPEQSGAGDIDTRTDVYSLGVVLYELLTGQLPFDASKWEQQPLYETLRQMQEQETVRPSLRAAEKTQAAAIAAKQRSSDPKRLASQIAGDLDWITMKSLEKDRTRRYGTPSEMAGDVRRFLDHKPVDARPASVGYQIGKYVRRHRFGVSTTALLALLLLSFAVLQTVQSRRIARERDRVVRIAGFMTGMFKVSDPSEARGSQVTAREILDQASRNIETGLARDPEMQAQMMTVMGKIYDDLGLYPQAESLLRRATTIRRSILGTQKLETATSMLELAWTLGHEGRYAEAEGLENQVLDIRRRILGPQNPDTVTAMANLAVVLNDEGHYAESEKLQRQALEIRRRVLGSDNLDVAVSMDNLATVLQMEARYPESERFYRDAIDFRRRILGADHPDTVTTMSNLANVLYREGRYSDAEKLILEVLEAQRRIFGPEHPLTLKTMNNLANVLDREHREAEAEKMCRETLDLQRRVLGSEHPETLMSMNNLTGILSKEGKFVEAEELGREVLDIRRRVLGPEHPLTLRAMSNLSDSLTKLGNWVEADKLLRQALNIQRRVLAPDHPDTALSTYNLACVLAHQGKEAEALSLLRDSVDHGLALWVVREMDKDPDLISLHGDPRFDALVAYANNRASSTSKK
jgi:serine/threonine protein kinase/tetratricopeptide (TPR) repeat protein